MKIIRRERTQINTINPTVKSSKTTDYVFWLAVIRRERRKMELWVLGREIKLKIRFSAHKF